MNTKVALVLAIGLIISSAIVSRGFSEMAKAIKSVNFIQSDMTLKVQGDDYRPLFIKQVQK